MTGIFTPIVRATVGTDWGPMHIATSERGVVAAGLLATEDVLLADLARRGHGTPLPLDAAPDGRW